VVLGGSGGGGSGGGGGGSRKMARGAFYHKDATPKTTPYISKQQAFGQAGNARAAHSAEAAMKLFYGHQNSNNHNIANNSGGGSGGGDYLGSPFFRANLITAYCRSGDLVRAHRM
jgi:hypothetical protein